MIGVSFQPGADQFGQSPNGGIRPSSGSGVQEAIKILSLRLPRVLGAQPAVNAPLMNAQPNSRVDSVVNQVMAKFGGTPPMAFGGPTLAPQAGGPSFTGAASPYQAPQQPWTPFGGMTPRVIIGGGGSVPGPGGLPVHPKTGQGLSGNDDQLSGGGMPPGMFEPLPSNAPLPPLPNFDQPIFGNQHYQPGYEPDYGTPLI